MAAVVFARSLVFNWPDLRDVFLVRNQDQRRVGKGWTLVGPPSLPPSLPPCQIFAITAMLVCSPPDQLGLAGLRAGGMLIIWCLVWSDLTAPYHAGGLMVWWCCYGS